MYTYYSTAQHKHLMALVCIGDFASNFSVSFFFFLYFKTIETDLQYLDRVKNALE